jgi:transposase
MNDNATVVGLDIAKLVFVAVGMNDKGKVMWKKKMGRSEVLAFFTTLAVVRIGIEACAGAHYWARKLLAMGHDVKLIAAQHVKPFVSGSKNDWNDAQAIAEIRSRGQTKYVPINTEAQQDLQMIHRARQALMVERTGLICRIRAFAGEYGKVFVTGVAKFRKAIAGWLGEESNGLSGRALSTLRQLLTQLDGIEEHLAKYNKEISLAAQNDECAKRLHEVPGFGPLTSTALVATVADPHHYPGCRDFSANVGLVPRQHSSGGKDRLYGITKRGDAYLRTLLIHCARAALRTAATGDKPDRMLQWALQVQKRRGTKVAVVALANKLARVAWSLMANGGQYQPVPQKTAPAPC